MALHSLYYAEVPLRNCSLTHSLSNNTKTNDLEKYIWVHNVRKLRETRMLYAFLADTIYYSLLLCICDSVALSAVSQPK